MAEAVQGRDPPSPLLWELVSFALHSRSGWCFELRRLSLDGFPRASARAAATERCVIGGFPSNLTGGGGRGCLPGGEKRDPLATPADQHSSQLAWPWLSWPSELSCVRRCVEFLIVRPRCPCLWRDLLAKNGPSCLRSGSKLVSIYQEIDTKREPRA